MADVMRSRARALLAVVALALVACATPAPPPSPARALGGRELLNSDRIERRFGSYGLEVLDAVCDLRVASLYSVEDGRRVTRTFAVSRLPAKVDSRFAAEDAVIRDGGSIGTVFQQRGWTIEKRERWIGELAAPPPGRLLDMMALPRPEPLAVHVYSFVVARPGVAPLPYATIAEVYHPDYLRRADVEAIYGRAATPRADGDVRAVLALVERAARGRIPVSADCPSER